MYKTMHKETGFPHAPIENSVSHYDSRSDNSMAIRKSIHTYSIDHHKAQYPNGITNECGFPIIKSRSSACTIIHVLF